MILAYDIAHYFFPRRTNDHKAKLLHNSSILLILVSLVVYQVLIQLAPATGLKILGYAANIPPSEVIEITNKKRVEAGLPELTYNPVLAEAARAKGEDMLNKDYWAHVSPDGIEPWAFFANVGYSYKYAGENLARDFSDPNSAVEAWMASPSHKENMLSPKYSEVGIAVVEGDLAGVDTTLIVQLFGTPLGSGTTAQVPVSEASAQEPTPTPSPQTTPANATPTIEPTPTIAVSPTPTPHTAAVATSEPISGEPQGLQVLISPFDTTKKVSLFTIVSLGMVMVVDTVLVSRRKITRVAGRTFAHLAFLGMILAIVIIARAGAIL